MARSVKLGVDHYNLILVTQLNPNRRLGPEFQSCVTLLLASLNIGVACDYPTFYQ